MPPSLGITEAQKKAIVKRWLAGEKQSELATVFTASQSTISQICRAHLLLPVGTRGEAQLMVHRSTGQTPKPRPQSPAHVLFVPKPNPPKLVIPCEWALFEWDRFWSFVEIGAPDECWPWKPTKKRGVHGHFTTYNKKTRRPVEVVASRVAWRLYFGEIPKGLVIAHQCDYPPCVNPGNLFACTQAENLLDAQQKGRASKIPWDEICKMRHLREVEGWTLDTLADKFECSKTQVSNIVNYRQRLVPKI